MDTILQIPVTLKGQISALYNISVCKQYLNWKN